MHKIITIKKYSKKHPKYFTMIPIKLLKNTFFFLHIEKWI